MTRSMTCKKAYRLSAIFRAACPAYPVELSIPRAISAISSRLVGCCSALGQPFPSISPSSVRPSLHHAACVPGRWVAVTMPSKHARTG